MTHEMLPDGKDPSGFEIWECAYCQRRTLIRWAPFKQIVVTPGDTTVRHIGAKGGISIDAALGGD